MISLQFEVLGQWEDPGGTGGRTLISFSYVDSFGRQTDLARWRVLDSKDFLLFTCCRRIRSAIALETHGELTSEDRKRIAEIVASMSSEKQRQSFMQRDRLLSAARSPRGNQEWQGAPAVHVRVEEE